MFKGTRLRWRARWWFAVDTAFLLVAVKREFDAAVVAQLTESVRS